MFAKSVLAIALLAVLVPSVLAQAAALTFRNDTMAAVVVQTGTILRGRVLNDQPLVLRAGASSRVSLNSDKLILIYDGKSNRILHQAVQKFQGVPALLSIQPDPQAPGKVKLVIPRAADPVAP
jgi:hypothetical protein